jgi:ABC-2 type transport system ATP-binding protein
MTLEKVLEVEGLTKSFAGKPAAIAVDGVSFAVGAGEIVGVLGANGAGKSTTIQMLIGTLRPTAGTIRYFGRDFVRHRSAVLEQVGYASGYACLPQSLTVQENLDVYGRLCGLRSAERRRRIAELLEFFGVAAQARKTMGKLSAGQVTRVMLTKAFLARPRVVLLDEPTASLDPEVCAVVRAFVLREKQKHGVAMVYTSHNMAEVTEVCDRVIFLSRGRIAAEDSPQQLAACVAGTVVRLRSAGLEQQLLSCVRAQSLEAGLRDGWVEIALSHGRTGALVRELHAQGLHFSEIEVRKPTLEDYFLKISKRERSYESATCASGGDAASVPLPAQP